MRIRKGESWMAALSAFEKECMAIRMTTLLAVAIMLTLFVGGSAGRASTPIAGTLPTSPPTVVAAGSTANQATIVSLPTLQPWFAATGTAATATSEAASATAETVMAATEQTEAAAETFPTCRVYGADPSDLWNRLFCALYVWPGEVGEDVGAERLDTNISGGPYRLVAGSAYYHVLGTADEFLHSHAEFAAHTLLERAFLQRDVWKAAKFLTMAPAIDYDAALARRNTERQQTLLSRLVAITRRLAMGRAAIAALPDNLAVAIGSERVPARFDPGHVLRGFLPSDLSAPSGAWVVLGRAGGPLAERHLSGEIGDANESAWLVMMRGPDGHASTLAFLAALASTSPRQAAELSVPTGTEFALVRRMMLIDDTGMIVPTKITEEVELRHYGPSASGSGGGHAGPSRAITVLRVSRDKLFQGRAGGLVTASLFQGRAGRLVMASVGGAEAERRDCGACHSAAADGRSINSFMGTIAGEAPENGVRGPLRETTVDEELAATARWLMQQEDFATIQSRANLTAPDAVR